VARDRVHFMFLDLPLIDLHEHATDATPAARCAGRQDTYKNGSQNYATPS